MEYCDTKRNKNSLEYLSKCWVGNMDHIYVVSI